MLKMTCVDIFVTQMCYDGMKNRENGKYQECSRIYLCISLKLE